MATLFLVSIMLRIGTTSAAQFASTVLSHSMSGRDLTTVSETNT